MLCHRLERIGLHDHACLVLDTEDERLEVASAFLHIGLQRGERCVYVADENGAARVLPHLRGAGGDPGRALASGSLVLTTDGGTCLRPGCFDPGDTFRSLEAQVEAALADGFRALRIVAEATWALGRSTKLERLAEYEERLQRTFRDRPIVALWLYDPWKCPPGLLRGFLRMHPLVIVRGDVHRNCLFVPAHGRGDGRAGEEEWRGALDAIVERARAEEVAVRRTEQLHESLEGGAHALWGWDVESERVTLEPQFAEMPGVEPSRLAVTLSEWEQVVHPDALGDLWRSARGHVEGRTPRFEHECRMRDRSGAWRWVQLRAKAVRRDASGRPLRISGTATDVTELRAARERRSSNAQLAAAARLASSVAREIDGPLADVTAGLGFLKELLERLQGASATPARDVARLLEVLEETRGSATRIRDVVDELPGAFRAPAPGEAVPCDVRDELRQAIAAAREEIAPRARLVAPLPDGLPGVLAQDRALRKVFLNLLLHAAHAIPEGSPEDNEIRLDARTRGEHVLVEVTDTGIGMSPQQQEQVLDLFFPARARRATGVGVGLSLCRASVEGCGGSLEVESEPGRGTTVRVLLPALPARAAEKEKEQGPLPAMAMQGSPPAAAAEPRRRVLIIDEEEPRAGSIARILADDHEVTALASAQEALRRIESGESWDVILCDLRTGELDGMEFCGRLHRLRPELAARLGFITEGPWPPEVRTFLACNTWPTIEKPADPEGVRAVVARMALQ